MKIVQLCHLLYYCLPQFLLLKKYNRYDKHEDINMNKSLTKSSYTYVIFEDIFLFQSVTTALNISW